MYLLDELALIDAALADSEATPRQENRGEKLAALANAAQDLLGFTKLFQSGRGTPWTFMKSASRAIDKATETNDEEIMADTSWKDYNQTLLARGIPSKIVCGGVEATLFQVGGEDRMVFRRSDRNAGRNFYAEDLPRLSCLAQRVMELLDGS